MSESITKRRAKAERQRANYGAYATEEFRPVGNPTKSLLRCVSGRFPEKPTARCGLRKLVDERQSAYAELIGRLMSGMSLRSSLTCLGLNYDRAREWIAIGLDHAQQFRDSYYSRFASDIHSAIAYCVGDCESRLAKLSPQTYLTSGPGRAFHAGEGTWQLSPTEEGHSELSPLSVHSLADPQSLANQQGPSPQKCAAAIEVLKQSGILGESFTAAADEQYPQPLQLEQLNTEQVSTEHASTPDPGQSPPDGSFHALSRNSNGEVGSPASS